MGFHLGEIGRNVQRLMPIRYGIVYRHKKCQTVRYILHDVYALCTKEAGVSTKLLKTKQK